MEKMKLFEGVLLNFRSLLLLQITIMHSIDFRFNRKGTACIEIGCAIKVKIFYHQ